jgi:SAM-dependent methyltransferase
MEKNQPQHPAYGPVVTEPLQISAPLARQRAPTLCHTDPVSRQNCSWNHGLWQYLRLLGLLTTPVHHAVFLREAFGHVAAGADSPRVLISGTADYSMLAHVLAIFGERNIVPAVTVVDRCETPLFLNRWYADRLSHSITTHCTDILEYQAKHGFDIVCSHSFLGQFDPPGRAQLAAKWQSLLRPGGLAVTINRVRPAWTMTTVGFSDEQADAFADEVLRKAQSMRTHIDIEPQQLADEARIYAARQSAYPVKSQQEIRELFEHAGFHVERLVCKPVSGHASTAVSGPTTPGNAEYACIAARRS